MAINASDIWKKMNKKGFRDAYACAHIDQGIAYQIAAIRKQRGWSQKDLSERLDMKSQSAVARMEDPSYGKISIATLKKLASAFDVALSIRFIPFTKLIDDRSDLSEESMKVDSFSCDISYGKWTISKNSKNYSSGLLHKSADSITFISNKVPANSDFYINESYRAT